MKLLPFPSPSYEILNVYYKWWPAQKLMRTAEAKRLGITGWAF